MTIASRIAALGENSNFVAFNAHWGFAFFLMTLGAHFRGPLWAGAVSIVAVALWKEFYFDIHNETNPPQTYLDGLLDFSGYAAGVLLGFYI